MTDTNLAGSTRNRIVPGAALASGFLKEAEAWIAAQGEVLSVFEESLTEWTKRWHGAIDTFSRSLQKMSECGNPIEFIQTQQTWLCDAVRSVASDARAFSADATVLTKKVSAVFEGPSGGHDGDLVEKRRERPEPRAGQQVEGATVE
jgi:hypothetical protein